MDINALRRMIASGELTEADLMAMSGSFNPPPPNALAEMLSEQEQFAQMPPEMQRTADLPMNAMRNEQTGKMTYFAPTGEQRGFSDTPYPANAPAFRPQQAQQGLGEEVEVTGMGKGRYAKDRRSVVLPDGRTVDLFPQASAKAAKAQLEQTKKLSEIANKNANTQKTLKDMQPKPQMVEGPEGPMWVTPPEKGTAPVTDASGKQLKSKAQIKIDAEREADRPAAQSRAVDLVANLDRLSREAKSVSDSTALGRITGIVGVAPDYPGGDAANTRAKLETLKSQVAFNVLQSMREASKTGGAVGQVSNFEQAMLMNNLAALDTSQSEEAFRANLQQIIDYANGAKERVRKAYESTYGALPDTQKQNKMEFKSMPAPQAYTGKRIQSPDGTIYKSDGKRWVRQ